MKVKVITSLAIAAFLTGCGGANDHPAELLGTWKSECRFGVQETITFDSQLTMRTEAHGDSNCTGHGGEAIALKADVLYDPELKTTKSGIEALKTQVAVTDVIITPYSDRAMTQYTTACPNQNWVQGQATSIMECERYVKDFEFNFLSLLYLNNNILYSSLQSEPKDADGYPSDVNFENSYNKQ